MSSKPEQQQHKADEAKTPKSTNPDNDIVKDKGAGEHDVAAEVTQSAKTPKDSEKSGDDAAAMDKHGIDTFAHVHPFGQDQLHAFVQWAKREVAGNQTFEKWQKLLEDFLSRKV